MQEDEQAKAEEELDPAVQERRRLHQAEQWRLQQLKTGAASEENANFQVHHALISSSLSILTHQVPGISPSQLGWEVVQGPISRLNQSHHCPPPSPPPPPPTSPHLCG